MPAPLISTTLPKYMKSKKKVIFVFAAVICAMHAYNSLRVRHNLLKCALVHPKLSPWATLLNCGDEGSFLTLTGLNYCSFRILVSTIFPNNGHIGTSNMGRPRNLDPNGRVGLILFFFNSRMRIKHLCMLFGVTPTTASDEISIMLNLMLIRLRRHKDCKIRWPKEAKMAELALLIHRREPAVDDVMGFMDGLRILIQCGESLDEQTTNYNGHIKDTCVNNIFLFGPDGIIYFAEWNAAGHQHDSTTATHLIDCVLALIGIYKISVDQGFPTTGNLFDIFVGPISTKRLNKMTAALRPYVQARSHIYTSLRQASEWEMSREHCKVLRTLPKLLIFAQIFARLKVEHPGNAW